MINNKMVNVFVAMSGGLIDDVKVFENEKNAINAWEEYTGSNWEEFCEHGASYEDKNGNIVYVFDGEYEGTTIYETIIE